MKRYQSLYYFVEYAKCAISGKLFKFNDYIPKNSFNSILLHSLDNRISLRDYNFQESAPFVLGDIMGLYPIVKSSEFDYPSVEARALLENAKVMLADNNLSSAFELTSEALNWLQQVCWEFIEHLRLFKSEYRIQLIKALQYYFILLFILLHNITNYVCGG